VADFDPIAAVSTENVNISWSADLDGTTVDPTNPPLTVQFAFPLSSGNPDRPARPVTWYPGSWLAGGLGGQGFIAQCLVGPDGGAVTLTAGQSYDVWGQILGTPEQPARFAGTLPVY
jgi:hypothetical protein